MAHKKWNNEHMCFMWIKWSKFSKESLSIIAVKGGYIEHCVHLLILTAIHYCDRG